MRSIVFRSERWASNNRCWAVTKSMWASCLQEWIGLVLLSAGDRSRAVWSKDIFWSIFVIKFVVEILVRSGRWVLCFGTRNVAVANGCVRGWSNRLVTRQWAIHCDKHHGRGSPSSSVLYRALVPNCIDVVLCYISINHVTTVRDPSLTRGNVSMATVYVVFCFAIVLEIRW